MQTLVPQTRHAIKLNAMRNISKIERIESIAHAIEERSAGVIQDASAPLSYILRHKIKCPFVGDQGGCLVYKYRPLIDRLFGIPIEIWNDRYGSRTYDLDVPEPNAHPTLNVCKLQERVARLSQRLEILLADKTYPKYPIWFFAIFPLKNFIEGGVVMTKKDVNPEEQKLKTRRRLMKLAAYSIPAIATILATEEAYAQTKKRKANQAA